MEGAKYLLTLFQEDCFTIGYGYSSIHFGLADKPFNV